MYKYERQLEILHSPFEISVHKKAFIAYCEVVIHKDGLIEYAVPSHTEKALQVYAEQHDIDLELARNIFYNDANFFENLLLSTGLIFVYYDKIENVEPLTEQQEQAIDDLIRNQCVAPNIKNTIR